MTEINNEKRNISVYQQLSGILNGLKTGDLSINDAMNKIQLKDTKPSRPYCKATSSGALAFYGISKQPIVLYADQWNKMIKIIKTGYVENYIEFNKDRLKYKTYPNKNYDQKSPTNKKFQNNGNISNHPLNENNKINSIDHKIISQHLMNHNYEINEMNVKEKKLNKNNYFQNKKKSYFNDMNQNNV
jgi:hypothetical protein